MGKTKESKTFIIAISTAVIFTIAIICIPFIVIFGGRGAEAMTPITNLHINQLRMTRTMVSHTGSGHGTVALEPGNIYRIQAWGSQGAGGGGLGTASVGGLGSYAAGWLDTRGNSDNVTITWFTSSAATMDTPGITSLPNANTPAELQGRLQGGTADTQAHSYLAREAPAVAQAEYFWVAD